MCIRDRYASALSASGLDEIPVPHECVSDIFSEKILFSRYALPGTRSLRKNVAACLKKTKSNAIILKQHGALCFGRDYEISFKTAKALEGICLNFINSMGGNISQATDCDNPPPPEINEIMNYITKEKGGSLIFCSNPQIIACSGIPSPLLPDVYKRQLVGGTMAATPLSCVAGYYALCEIERTDAAKKAGDFGDKLILGLQKLIDKYKLPFVAFNQGSICHLETVGTMHFAIDWSKPVSYTHLGVVHDDCVKGFVFKGHICGVTPDKFKFIR